MLIEVRERAGGWVVLRDNIELGCGVTRSAAVEIADALQLQSEARGDRAEVIVHGLLFGCR
jgi:hypothetical protein